MPYDSRIRAPACRARSANASGVAAEPTRTASYDASASTAAPPASRSRVSWVGTSEAYVGSPPARACTALVASTNPSAANGFVRSIATGAVPASRERVMTCSPPMCHAGSASSQVPGPPISRCRASAAQVKAETLSSTPFGRPLDPEVAMTTAMQSSSSGAAGSSGCIAATRDARSPASPAGTGRIAGPEPSRAAASAGSRPSTTEGSATTGKDVRERLIVAPA